VDEPSKPSGTTVRRRSARLEELRVPVTLPPRERELELGDYAALEVVSPLPATLNELLVVDLQYDTTLPISNTSSKQLDIRVEAFHEQWLGRRLMPLGMYSVLSGMALAGVKPDKRLVTVFRSTKRVNRFRNAVALFVTVDKDEASMFQAVTEGGERVILFRWFAPNGWQHNSPIVKQLLRVRHGDKRFFLEGADDSSGGTGGNQEESLLLFLQDTGMGSYVYCGRLGFLGMRGRKPYLEFRWQLMDAQGLSWMRNQPQAGVSGLESDPQHTAKP
jgi:hypothetical protein